MKFYNRYLYPLIRQYINGKISRELFVIQWKKLLTALREKQAVAG